ncbi:MAG TPA: bifunctional adenosylcobinamide kinase/adenosylcobinamide-phosphate guanylyltransferase [Planctomycetota bacterium]|nr:bifunctional adenosylcobinamide kinase/adenosylcobinamide-phosphate guanylyltransferase [Planctomycetota bacterium]
MTLVVLLGGARSGKSTLAVELATREGAPVTFLATGEAGDDEMAARIAEHRASRPSEWTTVEEPVALRAAIEAAPAGGTLVVDCLSLWVANVLDRGGVEDEARACAAAAAARAGLTVAVSNEVGLGVVPATPLGREYRDVLGRVNASWVVASDRAYFVVAGRALRLEDAL